MIVTVIATGFDKEKQPRSRGKPKRAKSKTVDPNDYSEMLRQAASGDEFIPKSKRQNNNAEPVDDEDLPDFLK